MTNVRVGGDFYLYSFIRASTIEYGNNQGLVALSLLPGMLGESAQGKQDTKQRENRTIQLFFHGNQVCLMN
jgi:hypothetical protein